ncbi:MAG: diguanylate cyclase [Thermoclostridium sp.]|nr:diguanylate cyclase [Thermoclostridium sp.]
MVIDNKQVRLLIVDDTPENLEISGKILEKESYDIYVADSGETALDLASNVKFDLILLDIMMPVMDGFEVCRRIREKPEYGSVPVIFLSAKAGIESVMKGFELGAVDYVRKPFNPAELVARVKIHVELKKTREELELQNSKLLKAYSEMELMAVTDPLTGLFNRREMLSRIEHEIVRFNRNSLPFTIVLSDIDFFKKVNDTYGHECGDFILKSVAGTLKSTLRKQDIVSRWGGEEFLLLLPGTDPFGAAIIAEKLRKKIEDENFSFQDVIIRITMTFGISSISQAQTADALVRLADKAMYTGKQAGRNRVV